MALRMLPGKTLLGSCQIQRDKPRETQIWRHTDLETSDIDRKREREREWKRATIVFDQTTNSSSSFWSLTSGCRRHGTRNTPIATPAVVLRLCTLLIVVTQLHLLITCVRVLPQAQRPRSLIGHAHWHRSAKKWWRIQHQDQGPNWLGMALRSSRSSAAGNRAAHRKSRLCPAMGGCPSEKHWVSCRPVQFPRSAGDTVSRWCRCSPLPNQHAPPPDCSSLVPSSPPLSLSLPDPLHLVRWYPLPGRPAKAAPPQSQLPSRKWQWCLAQTISFPWSTLLGSRPRIDSPRGILTWSGQASTFLFPIWSQEVQVQVLFKSKPVINFVRTYHSIVWSCVCKNEVWKQSSYNLICNLVFCVHWSIFVNGWHIGLDKQATPRLFTAMSWVSACTHAHTLG